MRQTIILVTIAIVGVSLAVGLLVGNLAGGGSDPGPPFATLPPAAATVAVPIEVPIGAVTSA